MEQTSLNRAYPVQIFTRYSLSKLNLATYSITCIRAHNLLSLCDHCQGELNGSLSDPSGGGLAGVGVVEGMVCL